MSCQAEAENALRLLGRALGIGRQFGCKRLEAFCLQTMGEAYQAMSRPEIALGMAGEFLALAGESNDKWIEAYGLASAGELKAQLGERAEGIGLLTTALASSQTLGSRDEAARAMRLPSTAYESRGNL